MCSSRVTIMTDLLAANIVSVPVKSLGCSEYFAVLSTIQLQRIYHNGTSRPLWQWEKSKWHENTKNSPFEGVLNGDVDHQTGRITNIFGKTRGKNVSLKNNREPDLRSSHDLG